MSQCREEALRAAARQAVNNAYCIVSGFAVGAAVLTTNNHIYKGCNTESVISGMGVCAERSAIDNAVAHGEYSFTTLAICSHLEKPIKPCGMCRQYIGEFSQIVDNDIKIILLGAKDQEVITSIYELYPDIFGPQDLNIDLSHYRR